MKIITFTIKKERLKQAIIQALHETGERAFEETQKLVPIETGALKSSGSIVTMMDGIVIKYTKEYSDVVERGWVGGRVWTNPYIRGDGIRVRGHYKNQPPREGVHFIENSLREYFFGSPGMKSYFQNELLKELEINFRGSIIKEI